MIKCNYCGREVIPQKRYSLLLMILLFILGIVPGLIYLVFINIKTPNKCPKCKRNVYQSKKQQNGRVIGIIVIFILMLLLFLITR